MFSLRRNDRDWFATPAGGTEFLVGRRVKYQPSPASKLRFGLMNSHRTGPVQRYDPEADYATPFGHWRHMTAPTALCESDGLMACINTYDRAYFTFGFCQFAAHVPDGDFVRFFRRLLRDRPSAAKYFPDLALDAAGHISRRLNDGLRDLETETDDNGAGGIGVTGLMRYLNPSDSEVEDAEVLNAARFIHWCENDMEMRKVMVAESVAALKSKLKSQNISRPFVNTKHADPLDTLCIALADILHHEGSKFAKVNAILASEADEGKALQALCNAGVDPGRNKKLLDSISELRGKGVVGDKRFSELMT